MSELNENVNETPAENSLDEAMDTSISGGTLEFVKENAAGLAVIAMAGYGAYQAGKKACSWIKSKLPSKDPGKPSLKERLAAKKAEKQVAKDEKKPKEET